MIRGVLATLMALAMTMIASVPVQAGAPNVVSSSIQFRQFQLNGGGYQVLAIEIDFDGPIGVLLPGSNTVHNIQDFQGFASVSNDTTASVQFLPNTLQTGGIASAQCGTRVFQSYDTTNGAFATAHPDTLPFYLMPAPSSADPAYDFLNMVQGGLSGVETWSTTKWVAILVSQAFLPGSSSPVINIAQQDIFG